MGLDLGVRGVIEPVIDLERTALQTHCLVACRSRFVVVVIILLRRHAELIGVRIEYRRAEEVAVRPVRLPFYYRHLDFLVPDILACDGLLSVIRQRHAE